MCALPWQLEMNLNQKTKSKLSGWKPIVSRCCEVVTALHLGSFFSQVSTLYNNYSYIIYVLCIGYITVLYIYCQAESFPPGTPFRLLCLPSLISFDGVIVLRRLLTQSFDLVDRLSSLHPFIECHARLIDDVIDLTLVNWIVPIYQLNQLIST